jgi:hypothetical protein
MSAPSDEASVAPTSTLIVAGWYADPMGSPQSRWWDGNTWTAELTVGVPAEPVAAECLVAPASVFAPELTCAVPSVDDAVPGIPVPGTPTADIPASAPQSRRQLRKLVGPLTTGAVQIDASAEAASEADPCASIPAPAPLLPAASAPSPVPVQPEPPVRAPVAATPFAVESAAPAFSAGALGFTLPPDPFAAPSAALSAEPQYAPPAFLPLPNTRAASPTLAVSARSTTAAVWLFTLLPVFHAALVWFVLVWRDLGSDQIVRYSVLGSPLFLYLVFALADRRVLRSRGFERTAPVVLALIPPIYLLVRAIRVGAAGIVPLLLWLLLQTAAYSFLLVQFPAVFALVPLTPAADSAPIAVVSGPITDAQRAAELTPTGMAAELTRQIRAKNLTFSPISCPPIPVTLDGTAVTCVGILASVKMNLNVVIDSRLPNSAFVLVSEAPAA